MAAQGAESKSIQEPVDAARPGALAGARLGIGAIPETLRSRPEHGHKGRRHLESTPLASSSASIHGASVLIDRSIGEPRCALRCRRTEARKMTPEAKQAYR